MISPLLVSTILEISSWEYHLKEANQIAYVVIDIARKFFYNSPTGFTLLLWSRKEDYTGLRDHFAREFTKYDYYHNKSRRHQGPFNIQIYDLDGNNEYKEENNRMFRCMISGKIYQVKPRVHNVFILVDSYYLQLDTLEKQIKLLTELPYWQCRAKVLVFWPWTIKQKELNYALQILGRLHIIRLLFVVSNEEFDGNRRITRGEREFSLYSWDENGQVSSSKCSNKAMTYIREFGKVFNNRSLITNLKRNTMLILTHRPIPRDFHKCECSIAASNQPPYVILNSKGNRKYKSKTPNDGLEIRLAEIVSNKFNFDLKYSESSQNDLRIFFEGKVDIVLGGLIPTPPCLDNLLDISNSYMEDHIVWFVREEPDLLPWKILIYSFQFRVWIASLSFFGVGYVMILISSWIQYKYACKMKWKVNKILWYSTYLFTGQPESTLSLKTLSFRFLAFLAMFGNIILSSFYLSGLYDQMTAIHSRKGLCTEQEVLADQELNRVSTISLFQLGYPRDIPIKQPDRRSDSVQIEELLSSIITNKTALVSSYVKLSHYTWPNYYQNGIPLIVPIGLQNWIIFLDERILTYHVCIYMTSGSIFLEAFNFVITRLVEGGIIELWRLRLAKGEQKAAFDRKQSKITKSTKGMSLTNFNAVFIFWIFGILISTLIFFGEILYFNFIQKENMKTKRRNKKN